MKLLLAGVAAMGLVQASLFAQIAAPPPGMRPDMKPITKTDMQAMVAKHFAAMDLNHDGKVTKEEIEAARRARFDAMRKEHQDREFARLDSNHDGAISKAEFEVPRMGGMGGPGDMPPPGGPREGRHGGRMGGPMGGPGMMPMGRHWFEQADANHDGILTLAEAQTAAAALFDKLDTNHDGTISPDEMRAAHDGMHGGGHGGHHGFGHHGGPGGDMLPPPPQG